MAINLAISAVVAKLMAMFATRFRGGSSEVVRQMQLDAPDQLAARVFEGYVVRKDLARRFKGRYNAVSVAELAVEKGDATRGASLHRRGGQGGSRRQPVPVVVCASPARFRPGMAAYRAG